MAKTIEIKENGEFGQIDVGPFRIEDVKVRIESRFVPDMTIDLSKKAPPTKKGSLMSLLNPRATILIGDPVNKAYRLDPATKSMRRVNPALFDNPTTFDKILSIGFLPIAVAVLGGGLLLFKTIKRRF